MDHCSLNPCLNGGTCREKIEGYICNCTEHWMGVNCEKPFDICELSPCKNNGTCHSTPNKKDYTCQCLLGFEGDTCESNIDDCRGVKVRL